MRASRTLRGEIGVGESVVRKGERGDSGPMQESQDHRHQRAMNLIETSIKSPVTVAVGVIFLVIFGVISLFRIPVQLTPDVETLRVTVSTFWRGASPFEMESEVVKRAGGRAQWA